MNNEETKKNSSQLAEERIARKEKREKVMREKKEASQLQLQEVRKKREETWWKEWESSGRLLVLFQPACCEKGAHIYRPHIENGGWDGSSLTCIAPRCSFSVKMEVLSQEEQNLMRKVYEEVYKDWIDRSKGI